jgi:CCR4-NOT transcription complex subunit 4
MEPDAVQRGFAFSLALDDDELQRLLTLSHEVGGFEPNPFDPLFEELPKLGIPIASLMAAQPRESLGGPYSGPFSPFAPSSPIETSSLPLLSEVPSGSILTTTSSEADLAPRTSSRFEFARRASLASTGRGQSPFHGRDDWGRTPSSNGYGGGADDMRAAIAVAKAAHHGYHPALVHLNSHVAAAAAASASASDSWANGGNGNGNGNGNGDSYAQQQQAYRSFPQPRSFGNNYSYGSPQVDGMGHGHSHGGPGGPGGYSGPPPSNGPGPGPNGPPGMAPPGYDSYVNGPASPQVYGQMGYVQQQQQRRY